MTALPWTDFVQREIEHMRWMQREIDRLRAEVKRLQAVEWEARVS